MEQLPRLGSPPTSIAILRALLLGDLLCAVPAFRALRAAVPDAHISLIGLPWARTFVERFSHFIDEFIEFPGHPALAEREADIRRFPVFLEDVQRRQFDLALQMHGSGEITNTLVAQFGASQLAGFYSLGAYCPDPHRFIAYPEDVREPQRHLRLMHFLGIPSLGDELEFPVREEDRRELKAIVDSEVVSRGEYVCLHAGSRDPQRRWDVTQFAQVADTLATRGLRVVLTGTRDEHHIASAIHERMRAEPVNLVGRTSLGALAALLQSSRLVVCNDTGVSHLADALDVPSVVIFMTSDPARWAPANRPLHRLVIGSAATPDDVLREADVLLSKEAIHAA